MDSYGRVFGRLADGQESHIFELTNPLGDTIKILDFGATIVSIVTRDRTGTPGDIVLGHDSAAAYEADRAYLGQTIGRYANRIANGRFSLGGHVYQLSKNEAPNHLHGGYQGFNRRLWTYRPHSSREGRCITLGYVSQDKEEGYPGNLSVTVNFTLDNDSLRIEYDAVSDSSTIINLTNHSYFNLKCDGTIVDHWLTLAAGRFTPVKCGLIPTGELKPVDNTPFDFRESTRIGSRIDSDEAQLRLCDGYDHNWVLDKRGDSIPATAAVLYEPTSGRRVQISTTEPGIQFYSGNRLDRGFRGKSGAVHERRSGLCLETQHFPDSPNHPTFPTVVLEAGQPYRSTTILKFSVCR